METCPHLPPFPLLSLWDPSGQGQFPSVPFLPSKSLSPNTKYSQTGPVLMPGTLDNEEGTLEWLRPGGASLAFSAFRPRSCSRRHRPLPRSQSGRSPRCVLGPWHHSTGHRCQNKALLWFTCIPYLPEWWCDFFLGSVGSKSPVKQLEIFFLS